MRLRSFLRFLQELTRQDEEDGEILSAMQSPPQQQQTAAPVRPHQNGTAAAETGQPPREDRGE